MATAETSPLSKILVKALVDRSFRQALIENPEKTVASTGIQLSSEEMQKIKEVRLEQWDSMTLLKVNDRLASFPDMVAGPHDRP